MKLTVLVLDYDGTIAQDGVLNPEVRKAIGEARAKGIVVLLATGRILDDLRRLVGDLRFVDGIVAENGAVMTFPDSGQSAVLAPLVPETLVDHIRSRSIPFVSGQCVVETEAGVAPDILAIIRDLELPQILAFNRSRLMVLPSGVNKATGLREALRAMRLSPHNAVGIGDAENDHDLLEVCELGVAVAWGSEALKSRADEVLAGGGPEAVAQFIRGLTDDPKLAPHRVGRRRVLLGEDSDGRAVSLAVRGRNVLVVGDPKSGKSWVTGLLCEQLILQRYSLCVVDPEGDYSGLEALPGVIVLEGGPKGPTPRELRTALRYPDVNVILDLSHMPHGQKWSYIRALLPGLVESRQRYGVPHRIVVDEAHYVLHDANVTELLDLNTAGYTLVTYQPSRLHGDVLAASEAIIVTRLTDAREQDALAPWCEGGRQDFSRLEMGQAAILPRVEEAGGTTCLVRLTPRLTPHTRHRHKYLDAPVAADRAFVFSGDEKLAVRRAHNLREFIAAIASGSPDLLAGHLKRSDFSRWVGEVFGDDVLASDLRTIEDRWRLGLERDVNDAIICAIETRYELPER